MENLKDNIYELLLCKKQGVLDPCEQDFVDSCIRNDEQVAGIWKEIDQDPDNIWERIDDNACWNKLESRIGRSKARKANLRRLAYALVAAILAGIVVVVTPMLRRSAPQMKIGSKDVPAGIYIALPGKDYVAVADGKLTTQLSATYSGIKVTADTCSLYQGEKLPTGGFEIVVPSGNTYSVVLPDGSIVKLNAHSTLTIAAISNAFNRKVALDGEAYFDIKPATEKPFSVTTKETTITVLGTSFNVKITKKETSVALVKGSVAITTPYKRLLLNPGQQALVKDSTTIEVAPFDPDAILGWLDGLYIYSDADLQEIVSTISRQYNYKIVLDDERTKEFRMTGAYDNKHGLNYFVETLHDILGNRMTSYYLADTLHIKIRP